MSVRLGQIVLSNMLTKELFTKENYNHALVDAVGDRISNGAYTDAVLAGIRCLSDTLRKVGAAEGDGAQLVGQVLGGSAPQFRLSKLQTIAEIDEQRGVEQLIRGIYQGIRNPRSHEEIADSEEYAVKVLTLIDLCLTYLARKIQEFDVQGFVDRIYDVHFVENSEYAQALVAEVPKIEIISVFANAFRNRANGDFNKVKYAFGALYQLMTHEQLTEVALIVGEDLRKAVDPSEFANVFRLLKQECWPLLPEDVRMRAENVIIEACKSGTHDARASFTTDPLGTWGGRFGRYFSRRDELAEMLISKLKGNWYSQNYVGKYFIYVLPAIVPSSLIEDASEALSYASIGNEALVVRNELLAVVKNYPKAWRDAIRVSVQERKASDPDYVEKILCLTES